MNEVKKNVFNIVNERIIAELEKGVVPWHQTWADAGIPANLISGRQYRNINWILLAMLGYDRNLFLTFNQVKEIGARVKKGEHAHMVVFSKKPETKTDEQGNEETTKRVLRYYMVFNIAQCENIPKKYIPAGKVQDNRTIDVCEEIIHWMPNSPAIVHNEPRAFYTPSTDTINMPKKELFDNSESYYEVLFHELIHSTGHTRRLNRKEVMVATTKDIEEYSFEELTAEIGACYLMFLAGITEINLTNSAAYIDNWLQRLKNDRRFIFIAASQAQRATDYILGLNEPKQDSETEPAAVETELSPAELDDLPF